MAKTDRSSDVIWFGDKSKNMFLQCRNYANTKDMVATFSDGSTLEFPTKSDLTPTLELLSQPPSDYCTFSQWVANAERCGNEVTLSFSIAGTIKEVSTFFLLKTIPEAYRPKTSKYISYSTQEGYNMLMAIQTDGQILLFTGGKAVSGFFLRQVITYPAAQ